MITICTKPRGTNQLAHQEIWDAVVETLHKRMNEGAIQCRLALVMPDHFHGLMSFSGNQGMQAAIKSLKSWLARSQSIQWQRDFFDHRLRGWESAAEKAKYIRMNPVRAGLVETPDQWPYWMESGRDTRPACP